MKVRHLFFLFALMFSVNPSYAELGQSVQYFAQLAVDGGATTMFVIHNPSDEAISVQLELYGTDGSVLSTQQVELVAGATKTVAIGGAEGSMKVGWAKLSSERSFTATEFFEFSLGSEAQPRVGVLPSQLSSESQLFCFLSPSGVNTGIAVANPSKTKTVTITVSLYDAEGELVDSRVIELSPLNHLARYLNESDFFPNLIDFEGAVQVEASEPVVLLTVRSDQGLLSTIAVVTAQEQAIAAGSVNNVHLADGAVTSDKIADGQVVKSLNGLTDAVKLQAGSNVSITKEGNSLTIASVGEKGDTGPQGLPGIQGVQGPQGRKGDQGDPGVFPEGIRVEQNSTSPNIIGGHISNSVTTGKYGATIGGGGSSGGGSHQVGAHYGTVSGGWHNIASGEMSTVGGGRANTAGGYASTVAGGGYNTASGIDSFVAGGYSNTASGDSSFAAGKRAKANHKGSFVWADSQGTDFASSGNNQFLIRAGGGVGIGSNSPDAALSIQGNNTFAGTMRLKPHSAKGEFMSHVHYGSKGDWYIRSASTDGKVILQDSGGRVGIGTSSPAGKLDVNGKIYQRGSQIHADYVFEPDFTLQSIEEHSRQMWAEKHLPAVPPRQMDETGNEILEMGAHRKGMLEELEKAHIYIEQLHKRLGELENRLKVLEK